VKTSNLVYHHVSFEKTANGSQRDRKFYNPAVSYHTKEKRITLQEISYKISHSVWN